MLNVFLYLFFVYRPMFISEYLHIYISYSSVNQNVVIHFFIEIRKTGDGKISLFIR